jgi:hypothetical protein
MRKTILILTALASLTIANTSRAAIGWTLEQCLEHWGPIIKCERVGARFLFDFSYDDYIINILLLHGKVSKVGYAKLDSKGELQGLDIEDIRKLLEGNAGEKTWSEPVKNEASSSIRQTWTAEGLCAVYDNKVFVVMTEEENVLAKKDRTEKASNL